ncbi:hypothetical protein R1sor_008830 [Riccia sorocarpa]|uniref:Uncharacterized protein n=1 Tax=Riccia sorocarpa TaxID=122646 RepID=A0ABD3I0R6_9MARC
MWKKGTHSQEQENKVALWLKISLPRWLKAKGSEREAIRANSGRQIEVLVMASTDPVDEEARLTDPVDEETRLLAVGGDEAAKFCVHLRDDIELQLESAGQVV